MPQVLPRPVVMQLASKEIRLRLDDEDNDDEDGEDVDDAWMRQARGEHGMPGRGRLAVVLLWLWQDSLWHGMGW